MKVGRAGCILVFIATVALFARSLQAHAAPSQQQFATNTPLPDGRIMYKVKAGDSCFLIAALHGITPEQLRELNQNINADCTNLIEGQDLLIGTGGPAAAATSTPGPPPTAGPPTITPTPFTGTTEICVLLFDDLNGDTMRQANEPVIPGGAISVAEISGKYSKTLQTAVNPDPTAESRTCFSDVPEGKYNIGVAIPDNYNPTMSLTYTLDVKAGDRALIDFGAQSRDASSPQPGTGDTGGGGVSPLLGVLGGGLLLGGLGLGWYALRLRNPHSTLRHGGLFKR